MKKKQWNPRHNETVVINHLSNLCRIFVYQDQDMNISSISCICEEQGARAVCAMVILDIIKRQKIRQSHEEIKKEIQEVKMAVTKIYHQQCSMYEEVKIISMDTSKGLKEVKSSVNMANMKLCNEFPITPNNHCLLHRQP